jgi:hypothetical protein
MINEDTLNKGLIKKKHLIIRNSMWIQFFFRNQNTNRIFVTTEKNCYLKKYISFKKIERTYPIPSFIMWLGPHGYRKW